MSKVGYIRLWKTIFYLSLWGGTILFAIGVGILWAVLFAVLSLVISLATFMRQMLNSELAMGDVEFIDSKPKSGYYLGLYTNKPAELNSRCACNDQISENSWEFRDERTTK